MKIKCIVVEDEPLAQERLRTYIEKAPELELLACFDTAMQARTYLKNNSIDLVFLDIHLGEFSGIQLLESLTLSCPVIFTTAYPDYALQGFELKAADYLLKPYTLERFLQALDRATQLMPTRAETPKDKNYVFIKTENRLEKVALDDLLYIEGMGDYRRIHTRSKRLMTLQTFSELEQDLPANRVCRVHKSYMVALDKIETIEKDRLRIGSVLIPVSETYREKFLEKIGV